MKIDKTIVLKDLNGKAIPAMKEDGEQGELTLEEVIITSLTALTDKAKGAEMFERYQLAQKIKDAKDKISLESKEIAKIKDIIGDFWNSPIVVGASWMAIEGESK